MSIETRFFPMMMRIADKNFIVVGGGKVAGRKIESVLSYGAKVKIISPKVNAPIQKMLQAHANCTWVKKEYGVGDLTGAHYVIAATNDPQVNRSIREDAVHSRLPVNVIDDPASCDFILPSIVRRGNMVIGVSTQGKNPGLAKKIKEKLETEFDESYSILVDILEEIRNRILNNGYAQNEKAQLLKKTVDAYPEILQEIKGGYDKEQIIQRFLE